MEENPIIISSLEDTILTEDYVNISYDTIGSGFSTTIFLKDISSITYGRQSHPILIFLAILLVLVGIASNNEQVSFGCIVVAIVFILFYFFTKKDIVVITAHSSDKIKQVVNNKEEAEKFVDDVIEAKKKL